MHNHSSYQEAAARYRVFFGSGHTASAAGEASPSLQMDRLLSPLDMDAMLEAYGRSVQAPHPALAGSLFVKMYGRMLTGIWKLLSVYNLRVGLTLSETTLRWPEPEKTASLLLPDRAYTTLPQEPAERAAARDEWFNETTERHLRPLLDSVSFRSGLSKAVLWENVFIYLHHGYNEWRKEAATETDRARIESDYAALTREGSPFCIPGGSFENPLHAGEQVRIRRTCCLKHALPNGTPCYSCPNLCDSKRKEIYVSKK